MKPFSQAAPWICPFCEEPNNVKRAQCNNCGKPRPQEDDEAQPGDTIMEDCHITEEYRQPMVTEVIGAPTYDEELPVYQNRMNGADGEVLPSIDFIRYPFAKIKEFTDDFNPRKMLGKRAQGTVFQSKIPGKGYVAIKRCEKLKDENTFQEEILPLSYIRHPNIVALTGWGYQEGIGVGFLIYAFVPGGDLQQMLDKAKQGEVDFKWDDRLHVLHQVAQGLSYMVNQEKPIFHRDIKAANIIIGPTNVAKLCDFGLARSCVDNVFGTPGYMCPVYKTNGKVSEQSEVYAFGIVLLQALVNATPAIRIEGGGACEYHYPLQEKVKPDEPGAEGRILDWLDSTASWDDQLRDVTSSLALQCVRHTPDSRPSLRQIVSSLTRITWVAATEIDLTACTVAKCTCGHVENAGTPVHTGGCTIFIDEEVYPDNHQAAPTVITEVEEAAPTIITEVEEAPNMGSTAMPTISKAFLPADGCAVTIPSFIVKLVATGTALLNDAHKDREIEFDRQAGIVIGRRHHIEIVKDNVLSFISSEHFSVKWASGVPGHYELLVLGRNRVWLKNPRSKKVEVVRGNGVQIELGAFISLDTGGQWTLSWNFVRHDDQAAEGCAFEPHLADIYKYSEKEIEDATKGFSQDRVLGRGAVAVVYRCVLQRRSVAVKAVRDADQSDSFEREVKILDQLDHQNVIKIFGWGMGRAGEGYIVTEFLSGGDVNKKLQKAKGEAAEGPHIFLWSHRIEIAKDVARGLTYIVNLKPKVFHRDIKPGNILLDPKGAAKLADFGIARRLEDVGQDHLTVNKISCTPGYECPVYRRNGRFSEASEVYSFGVVLLELITNITVSKRVGLDRKLEFPQMQEIEPEAEGAYGRVISKRDVCAQWPCALLEDWAGLSLQCVAADPRERPTFKQMVLVQDDVSLALRKYELFHQLPRGCATVARVENSDAGLAGWASAQIDALEAPRTKFTSQSGLASTAVLDLTGKYYTSSKGKSFELTQRGNNGLSTEGFSFTVQGDTVSLDSGRSGKIVGNPGSFTIAFTSGERWTQYPEQEVMGDLQRAAAELDALKAQAEDIAVKLERHAVTSGQAKSELAQIESAAQKVEGDIDSISSHLSIGKDKAAEQSKLRRQKKELLSRLELFFTRLEALFTLTKEAEEPAAARVAQPVIVQPSKAAVAPILVCTYSEVPDFAKLEPNVKFASLKKVEGGKRVFGRASVPNSLTSDKVVQFISRAHLEFAEEENQDSLIVSRLGLDNVLVNGQRFPDLTQGRVRVRHGATFDFVNRTSNMYQAPFLKFRLELPGSTGPSQPQPAQPPQAPSQPQAPAQPQAPLQPQLQFDLVCIIPSSGHRIPVPPQATEFGRENLRAILTEDRLSQISRRHFSTVSARNPRLSPPEGVIVTNLQNRSTFKVNDGQAHINQAVFLQLNGTIEIIDGIGKTFLKMQLMPTQTQVAPLRLPSVMSMQQELEGIQARKAVAVANHNFAAAAELKSCEDELQRELAILRQRYSPEVLQILQQSGSIAAPSAPQVMPQSQIPCSAQAAATNPPQHSPAAKITQLEKELADTILKKNAAAKKDHFALAQQYKLHEEKLQSELTSLKEP